MKKVLFASTALVAAGLMTAGGASASEKIKLNLGGYSKWWVVGQFNDDNYTKESAGNVDYNTVDIKGDNEIFFGGSTTLDNGMKVGVQIELEAGGHTDQGTDTIDESYMFVETGFGKFIVGSENNGTYLLHVMAPDAAGNWGEGGIMTGGAAIAQAGVRSITPGATANGNNTTAIVTDNDAEKITYVAPTFFGLTVGASYVPSAGDEDDRTLEDVNSEVAEEIFGVGALYANTFSGVGLKVSAGWVTYDIGASIGTGAATVQDAKTGVREWSAGTQLSYAGFTLGGSYRNVSGDEALNGTLGYDVDGRAYDVGVQYASGPYAVSLAYFNSSVEGLNTVAENDEITFWQLSGKYALGPGVDVLASVGHAEFDDETREAANGDANHNEGWTVMTGMSLAF